MNADRLLISLDNALRTLTGAVHAARPLPAPQPGPVPPPLSEAERRLSGALMRVNHVGEVCAQALYQAQALTARDPALRERMAQAAREEIDHLAWTQQRLDALGDRRSVLNPLWYAGAFGIGLLAGRAGDAVSLGFVVETERQVEQHLAGHLDRLPAVRRRRRRGPSPHDGPRRPASPGRWRANARRRPAGGSCGRPGAVPPGARPRPRNPG